jgi:hypothetical protein
MKDDTLGLVGKTIGEASSLIDQEEFSFRVVSRDGVARVCTRDYDTHRINLTMVEGKIISYTFG